MPYKERFVMTWTDKCPHFGNRVSSRAEGAHAKLKSYLQVSTGDLDQVVSKICLAVENEFHEISSILQSEQIRVPHRCRILPFKFLINHISHFALSHLFKQYEMVKFGTLKAECSGHFAATMGLPCAHMILKESSLLLNFIDSQWILDTITLTTLDGVGYHSGDDGITELCSKLLDRYQEVPIFEKKEIEERLALMLDASKSLPLEPNVQLPKRRPLVLLTRGRNQQNRPKEHLPNSR